MTTTRLGPQNTEAAIFARLWDGQSAAMTPALARHVLKLKFEETDTARMHDLAEKNREGQLTDAEREELDNYVKVGDLLAILQSKARKLLKAQPGSRNGHG
jgi:hypothetical protein